MLYKNWILKITDGLMGGIMNTIHKTFTIVLKTSIRAVNCYLDLMEGMGKKIVDIMTLGLLKE